MNAQLDFDAENAELFRRQVRGLRNKVRAAQLEERQKKEDWRNARKALAAADEALSRATEDDQVGDAVAYLGRLRGPHQAAEKAAEDERAAHQAYFLAREVRRKARDELRVTLKRQFESLPLVELMEQRAREEAAGQPPAPSSTRTGPEACVIRLLDGVPEEAADRLAARGIVQVGDLRDLAARQGWTEAAPGELPDAAARRWAYAAARTVPGIHSRQARLVADAVGELYVPQPSEENATPAEEESAGRASDPMDGRPQEDYDRQAKEKNKRQLLAMLKEGRKDLAHHGRRSWMGREAKKKIAAAEAELRARGIEVPPEGNGHV